MGKSVNKRVLGDIKEYLVTEYLSKNGYEILERNFRCRLGEIDIVAKESGYLVFIEVKYRSSLNYGSPELAVNYKKQNTIYKVAQYYCKKNSLPQDCPSRFDVVSVLGDDIKVIKNAFGGF
ncbi:MAG: YraN family protein [Lachnospiraceae bacterium]|nr:YraN family protein [Lachnospiraceae bacterium]